MGFFILSGVFLGIAILTKEIALLFLPLPLLIFLSVPEYRNKKCFLCAVVNILVALVVFVPWILYLWQNDGLKLLLGRLGPVVATNIVSIPVEGSQSGFEIVRSCLNNVVNFALGVWHYYYVGRNAINANFILAPAFLMAWVFAVIMAIRKNRYAIILVLNFLLFLPILFFVGKNDMRLGQGLFILLLSYVVPERKPRNMIFDFAQGFSTL